MIRGFYQAAKSSCAGNGDFVFALTLIFKAPPQGQTQILESDFSFSHIRLQQHLLTLYGEAMQMLLCTTR